MLSLIPSALNTWRNGNHTSGEMLKRCQSKCNLFVLQANTPAGFPGFVGLVGLAAAIRIKGAFIKLTTTTTTTTSSSSSSSTTTSTNPNDDLSLQYV